MGRLDSGQNTMEISLFLSVEDIFSFIQLNIYVSIILKDL